MHLKLSKNKDLLPWYLRIIPYYTIEIRRLVDVLDGICHDVMISDTILIKEIELWIADNIQNQFRIQVHIFSKTHLGLFYNERISCIYFRRKSDLVSFKIAFSEHFR